MTNVKTCRRCGSTDMYTRGDGRLYCNPCNVRRNKLYYEANSKTPQWREREKLRKRREAVAKRAAKGE